MAAAEPFPAIVCQPPTFTATGRPNPTWRYTTNNTLPRGPATKELQVRILASGVCHTDLVVSSIPPPYAQYPVVLGHEGAGVVEAVGDGVSVAHVGDLVLLSYSFCDECELCEFGGSKAWCERFTEFNTAAREAFFVGGGDGGDGHKMRGKFFGQSSFAGRTLVDEASVVNVTGLVHDEDELKLLAPLGCGVMTGAGNMHNIFKVGERDAVLVTGLGGVGLGAVMAAKARGAKAIIVVDRVKERLDLAKELGATHLVDTTGVELNDLAAKIKEVAGGIRIAYGLETTGVTKIIDQGIMAVGHRGHFATVGVPPFTDTITMNVADVLNNGKTYSCNFMGDSDSKDMIPQMIEWWRHGKMPLEKLVKYFKAEDFEQALHGMHDGSVIKPVLLWQ